MSVLFPKTHNYKQRSPGTRVKGKWVEGIDTPGTFTGNVQSITQKEAAALTVGRDNLGKIKIYTDQVFNVANETTNQNGDLVEYQNEWYEVLIVNPWDHDLVSHTKYFAELRKNV